MGRYRTGLILASPAYDTYGVLRAFALDPMRSSTRMSLDYLLKRTISALAYDIVSTYKDSGLEAEDLDKLLRIRIGANNGDAHARASKSVADATVEERVDLYVEMCKSMGIELDREALLRGEVNVLNKNGSE